MKPLYVIIMAAGNSTRLKSETTKILHPICGRPMIDYVLAEARALRPQKIYLVLGNDRDRAMAYLQGQKDLQFVHQKERLGTAHAVQMAVKAMPAGKNANIAILSGDVPCLKSVTLKSLLKSRRDGGLSLLTAILPNPFGYGRIVRDVQGQVKRIVEEKNLSPEQRQLNEINAGVYASDLAFLRPALRSVKKDPVKREFYLTDIVAYAEQKQFPLHALVVNDPHEILGINTRAELAYITQMIRREILAMHLENGVGLEDPETTYLDVGVRIGADTFLQAGVHLHGTTRIGKGCVIEAGCMLRDATLGDRVHLKAYSYLEDCRVKDAAVVGPFARLRPGTELDSGAHVGNFVELKKTRMGKGSKANHLSYLGDATIGSGVNVGAGTITCNYDGVHKYPTVIGDGVFIGSDTQLVAPVKIGKEAYIGAGTTITEDVPAGALAVSRVPQRNIPGYNVRKKKRLRSGS